jgi:hypothetical protein
MARRERNDLIAPAVSLASQEAQDEPSYRS